ncbi:polysaccharide biosynthesis protein [Flavobacterium aciduliphilum]|uniref:FlaA1/EpsC-like NDP-sugar epimerase n=1 Tax=Flavobacterium aciduliphilum TaxID=1101402 RepID=A0A328Y8I7_9FLAO|nr:nucleoside-diphosphate sugar epimerase/dehydratase [Flavobacterium aciduliphilum]RAR70229.1 FlaA1/EpsC-like NDP-sugar epimerase [Flavobacterium aciduliphilum]
MDKIKRPSIFNFFSSKGHFLNPKKFGYLPRWIILFIDLGIILFSGTLTYFLLQGMGLNFINRHHLLTGIILITSVNFFFFKIFRTHSGIIRHTSLIDSLKLLFSQFSTFAVIVFLNYLIIIIGRSKLFMTTGAFLYTLVSFSLLFFLRIVVKYLYDKLGRKNQKTNAEKIKALIYGIDDNAIAVANALKVEKPSRFKICGFIDSKSNNSTMRILNLPIFPLKKGVPTLLKIKKVEALIIADNTLSKVERINIAEECISYGFKIFSLPVVSNWSDGTEIAKSIKSFDINDLLERNPIRLDTDSISKKLENKAILVTGAAGSIGSEIVRQIINFKPIRVILLDQAETPLHNLSLEIHTLQKEIEIYNSITDVRDYESLERVFADFKPNVVFHAAAYKHVPMMEENPGQAIFTNVLGSKNVTDLSQKYNIERFVMVSTDKAVNPSSVMGASKRIAEMYVQSKHFSNLKLNQDTTKFITTRFGNVLGSNGSVVPLFTKQIQEGGPVTITHPDIIRYFMTIPEACQLVMEAGAMGSGGEIYIFDMGEPVKIIDLAHKMIRLAGYKPDLDIKIAIVGLRPGEKLYEELLNNSAENLPTHNEKIMIAVENCKEHEVVSKSVELLIDLARTGTNQQIVSKMKKIVPEFKSLNSTFEALDVKD